MISVSIIDKISNFSLLKDVYVDVAQPSVRKVGHALETVIDLSNTLLLPIKLINEKSHILFSKHMEIYRKNLEGIDDKDIAIVPPEIGVPILEKLTYTSNETIAEMFINLLTTASSLETSGTAHPRFFHIISNLSVDEAQIIKFISGSEYQSFPYITYKATYKDDEAASSMYSKKLTGIEREVELLYPHNINLYLDNFVGLGVLNQVEGLYNLHQKDKVEQLKGLYLDTKKAFEDNLNKREIEYNPTKIITGSYELTRIGASFIDALNLK